MTIGEIPLTPAFVLPIFLHMTDIHAFVDDFTVFKPGQWSNHPLELFSLELSSFEINFLCNKPSQRGLLLKYDRSPNLSADRSLTILIHPVLLRSSLLNNVVHVLKCRILDCVYTSRPDCFLLIMMKFDHVPQNLFE